MGMRKAKPAVDDSLGVSSPTPGPARTYLTPQAPGQRASGLPASSVLRSRGGGQKKPREQLRGD